MSISLIIPVKAKTHRLRLTLAGIRGQNGFQDIELILVADQPSNPVRELLSTVDIGRVIETPGLGRAGARNCGAAVASGNLLIFIDDDILVEHDFLHAHRDAQIASPGLVHGQLREIIGLIRVNDPAQGGFGCPPIREDELVAGRWQLGSTRVVANPLEQAAEHAGAVNWPWLASAGANISIPRELWRRVGGFDESYGTLWGVEDIDFAYRLWNAAIPISMAPQARGFHMSHYKTSRWQDHCVNLRKFQDRASCPEVLALDELLSPAGSLDNYIQRVYQIRQDALASARSQ